MGKKFRSFYKNKDTGASVYIGKSGVKEVLNHDYKDVEQLQSIASIPQIIENSIYIESRENTDLGKHKDVSEYHYYVCGIKIDGVDYTVRVVIAEQPNGNRYYDHKLSKIEKGKLLDSLSRTTPGINQKESSSTDVKDTKLVSLLQVNSSKLLDENGEPKAEDISKFESEKGDTVYRSGEFSPASDAEIGDAVRGGKSLGVEVEVVNEPGSENAGYYDTKTGQIVVNSATGGEACLVIYMTSLGARLKRLLIS